MPAVRITLMVLFVLEQSQPQSITVKRLFDETAISQCFVAVLRLASCWVYWGVASQATYAVSPYLLRSVLPLTLENIFTHGK